MIKENTSDSGSALSFKLSGEVTREDCDVLISRTENAIQSHNSVNLLLDMTDFAWETSPALAQTIIIGDPYKGKIARCAIVGDQNDMADAANLAGGFQALDMQLFAPNQLSEAEAWIEAKKPK